MIRESISTQLMRWVFFWYCIVALTVTGIQVFAEYQDTQQSIQKELASYQLIFDQVVGKAMWNLDRDGLAVILNSMVNVPVIEGVKISREDELFMARGRVTEGTTTSIYDAQFDSHVDLSNETTFFHQYPIQYNYSGSTLALGTVTLYSSSAVVFSRVKTGFLYIFINAILKTVALWLIFLWVSKRVLIKPLKTLTRKVQDINFDNLQSINFENQDESTQEMYQLHLAFVEMGHKLSQAKKSVESFNNKLEIKVTERTAQLALEKDRAIKAESIKADFLAVISHEIRTPLNGMMGMLDILARENLSEKQTRQLMVAKRSADDLRQLMNDILDISQLEANELTLHPQPVGLSNTLNDMVNSYANLLHEKGLSFTTNIQVDTQTVLMDENRVRQIIHNLLTNACKFTLSGGVEFHCYQRLGANENTIQLACKVVDTGVGILPEHIEKLFQVFTQADSSHTRRFGGAGLGLTLVKKLCETMGGKVWVESQIEQGSAFHFEINLTVPPVQQAHLIEPPTPIITPLSGHILLVEDNLINQEVMKDMLADLNITCDVANNGQEGFALIQSGQHYSLVIMDCQMPVMDGYDCTLNIRQWEHDQGLPHLPIVALTANTQQSDLQKCLDVGMDQALTKPIDMQTIYRVLSEYLSAAPAAQ